MTDPSSSATDSDRPQSENSRLFLLGLAIALGLAVTGFLLGVFHFFLTLPEPIAARSEILGGVMIVLAGAFLILANFAARGKTKARTRPTYVLAALFFAVGCFVFAKGYIAESTYQQRFDNVKTNLDAIKRAIENYEKSTTQTIPPISP